MFFEKDFIEVVSSLHGRINKTKQTVNAKIIHKHEDGDERLFYAVVIEPMTDVTDTGDSHGDIMTPEEVIKSAHYFMEMGSTIFKGHLAKVEAKVVESYISPVDFTPEGSEVKILKGSWVMAVKVLDDEMWESIKSGEITAFSPGGFGVRVDLE